MFEEWATVASFRRRLCRSLNLFISYRKVFDISTSLGRPKSEQSEEVRKKFILGKWSPLDRLVKSSRRLKTSVIQANLQRREN